MRTVVAFVASIAFLGGATAVHPPGCVPTFADPATVNEVDVSGELYYFEERGVPDLFATQPPLPFSGILLGEATAWYEEGNDLFGLQRGTIGGIPECWPGLVLCLLDAADDYDDEDCGHGSDPIVNRFHFAGP